MTAASSAERDQHRLGVAQKAYEPGRAGCDRPTEEVGRTGTEDAARRHGVAAVAPVVRPAERLRPLRLQVRPGGAVEKGSLELAPPSLERDPGERPKCWRRIARNGLHDRADVRVWAARVVASDALFGRAAEVQRARELVRMRSGGHVDDGMRSGDELELVVAPRCTLGALVRAVADLGGPRRERCARGRGVNAWTAGTAGELIINEHRRPTRERTSKTGTRSCTS
jgi:hypothetical protein